MLRKVLFLVFVSILCVSVSQATIYTFDVITSNGPNGSSIGDQLSMEVYADGNNVSFKFSHLISGIAGPVISEIYFDDGSILAFATLDESLPGVDFKEDKVGQVSPPNLPGGNLISPPFVATTAFSIEAANPAPQKGVGFGEWLIITYSLQGSHTIDDINDELANGDLRVGMHVISIPQVTGGTTSESYVTPEPATLALLGLGGFLLRRKNK